MCLEGTNLKRDKVKLQKKKKKKKKKKEERKTITDACFNIHFYLVCFVCVEVLRPSQPNRVMSSAVSLPNHTFTGQA